MISYDMTTNYEKITGLELFLCGVSASVCPARAAASFLPSESTYSGDLLHASDTVSNFQHQASEKGGGVSLSKPHQPILYVRYSVTMNHGLHPSLFRIRTFEG
jgi:hypothetical protein